MVAQEIREQLRAILQREVVLATGCTEPGAVALCVAKARETLGCMPTQTRVVLSKNVYKNAMGVGIPGTGMIGLPITVAIALTNGDSKRELEILTVSQDAVAEAKEWLSGNIGSIKIEVNNKDCDKLYIECHCSNGNDESVAIISGRHTNFVYLSHNAEVLLDNQVKSVEGQSAQDDGIKLTERLVYDYATTAPIEELEFINETVKYNKAASEEGMKGYGLHTGVTIGRHATESQVLTVIARTVAASDARMDGCTLPVYSNSGSGNQGIACTLPVYEFGMIKDRSEEQITRALILSHLTSIYVKRGIGRLSALCGLVNASIGVTSAITYLKGGSFEQIGYAIKNLINTIAGMVCDGAKPSCALKMSTGVYSAIISSQLAIQNYVVDQTDGLSEKDIDLSIRNLGHLGHDGMNETDDIVLEIMTHKES